MRSVYVFGLLLGCLATAQGALAAAPGNTPVLELDANDPKCTIQSAGNAEAEIANARYIKTLDQQLAGMRRWDAFMASRKWKKNVPMGDQMTPKELATFELLRQQTKVGLVETMFADKRVRDLRVFLAGAKLAEDMRAQKDEPKAEGSEEFVITAILVAGRDRFRPSEDDIISLVKQTGRCTLERALVAKAQRSFDVDRTTSEVNAAQSVFQRLADKHGRPINRDLLDTTERAQLDQAASAVSRSSALVNYYFDLLLLARLESVSKIQRDVRAQSQIDAPGDVEKINDSINAVWDAWKKDGRISADQDLLSKVLNFINEKIPGEFSKSANVPSRPAKPNG